MHAVRRHAPLVLLAFAALAGCNAAHQRAMERVKHAEATGDTLGLATAWRDACRADPNDTKACAEADRRAREITDATLVKARPACDGGDVDGCLDALQPARDVNPESRAVTELVDRAGKVHVDRCAAFPVQSPADALALVSCIAEKRARIGTATYRGLEAVQRERAAGVLATQALDPLVSASPAAQFALWTGTQCLAPRSAASRGLEPAKASFDAAGRIPVSVRVTYASSERSIPSGARDEVARSICASLGDPLACVDGARRGIAVEAVARIGRLRYGVSDEERHVQYEAGFRRVANADYTALLEARVAFAEADTRARSDLDGWEKACRRANRRLEEAGDCVQCRERFAANEACGNAQEAHRHAEHAARELAALDTRIGRTPRELEEPVLERFGYVERTHRWTGEWEVELVSEGRVVASSRGTVDHADVEHVGFGPAGLAADPFEGLPVGLVDEAVNAAIDAHAKAFVKEARLALARRRAADCAGAPAWSAEALACWAESQRWADAALDGDAFVRTAAAWSSQPVTIDCW